MRGALQSFFGRCALKIFQWECIQYSLMPAPKKAIRDKLSRLNGRLPSPKKAIKRVAVIALSPIKACPQKKHRHEDPEDDHVKLRFLAFTRN
jgi:hypothetical protein